MIGRGATIVIRIVAVFYIYGAAVHVANILGFSGYDWATAPAKWQLLDIVYLMLDVTVVVGLVRGWKIGFVAFYTAAISQIVLYTMLRDWILDVPPEFSVSEEQSGHLATLAFFHVVTVALVSSAWVALEWSRPRSNPDNPHG